MLTEGQKADLKERGFTFAKLDNLKRSEYATYYTLNKNSGELVTMRLPADAWNQRHYLAKGFVLNPEELKTDVSSKGLLASRVDITLRDKPPSEEYVCPVCPATFPRTPRGQRQFAGHKSGHARSKK